MSTNLSIYRSPDGFHLFRWPILPTRRISISIGNLPMEQLTHTPPPTKKKNKNNQKLLPPCVWSSDSEWEEVSELWLLEWNFAGTLSISTPGTVKTPNASQMQGISTHIWNDPCFLKEICAHICTYVVYSLLHTYTSMNVKTKYSNKIYKIYTVHVQYK